MAIRLGAAADRQHVVDIWNQNRPIVQAYWPEGPASIPAWTLADAQRFEGNAKIHYGVAVSGATVNAFLAVALCSGFDQLVALMVRLNDATGSNAQKTAFLRTRLRTDGKALLLAWAQNAQGRAAPYCEGGYPLGGNAGMLEMLSNMTAANGVVGDTTTRTGWVIYRPTPAQLIAGLNGVT